MRTKNAPLFPPRITTNFCLTDDKFGETAARNNSYTSRSICVQIAYKFVTGWRKLKFHCEKRLNKRIHGKHTYMYALRWKIPRESARVLPILRSIEGFSTVDAFLTWIKFPSTARDTHAKHSGLHVIDQQSRPKVVSYRGVFQELASKEKTVSPIPIY